MSEASQVYHAWRISYQSSEQAARAAFAEIVRLRAALAIAERRNARLEQGLWRAADALHANAEAWQLEGYPTNARIAAGQRLDAARLLATPAPQTPSEGGTDG